MLDSFLLFVIKYLNWILNGSGNPSCIAVLKHTTEEIMDVLWKCTLRPFGFIASQLDFVLVLNLDSSLLWDTHMTGFRKNVLTLLKLSSSRHDIDTP